MAEAPKIFVIQLRANPNFCLGIDSAVAGAKVTLHRIGTTVLTQWVLERDTGYIKPVKNTDLVLDFEGDVLTDQRTLIVAPLIPLRLSQKWDWWSSTPRILNRADEAYGIDNYLGEQRVGNPVYLWHLGPDNDHQQWLLNDLKHIEQMLLATAAKPE